MKVIRSNSQYVLTMVARYNLKTTMGTQWLLGLNLVECHPEWSSMVFAVFGSRLVVVDRGLDW